MKAYILQRLLLMPLSLLGISLMLFALTRALPGGPLERRLYQEGQLAAERGMLAHLSEPALAELRRYYGLDKPLLAAYGSWLGELARGQLGISLRYQKPIAELLAERLPVSLMFGASSLVLGYGGSLLLGLWFAYRPASTWVRAFRSLLLVLHAIPSSILAMLLFLLVARTGWLPLGGLTSPDFAELSPWGKVWDVMKHSLLPLTAYAAHQLALLSFLFRDQLLLHLDGEPARYALAKGASRGQALLWHALPLGILPLLQQLGHQLSLIFAGSFVLEKIFNLNGCGLLLFDAFIERDYPLVIGFLSVLGGLHVLGNLVSDLSLALFDPRVRLERGA